MESRAPDRVVPRMEVRTTLPPRPDSPRLGGASSLVGSGSGSIRAARLAQTRVWGAAAAWRDEEPLGVLAAASERRPVSVFGSLRSVSGFRNRSDQRTTTSFRRAASSHRYKRVSGKCGRGASGTVRIAPSQVLREQLAAIDEGLGAVTVTETPAIHIQRKSSNGFIDSTIQSLV